MAGKGDEAVAGKATAEWLDDVFGRLQILTDEAIAVIAAAAAPTDVAEAEKRARAVGVLARTAKAVAALKARPAARSPNPDEDEMSDDRDPIDDAEEQRLRAELQSRVDHLFAIAERKGFGSAGGGADAEGGAGVKAVSLGVTFTDVFRSADLKRAWAVMRLRAVTEEI